MARNLNPIGEQYRCPECFQEIGTPETTHDQMARLKGRHRGSNVCAENRKLIQFALGKMAGGPGRATTPDNVIITEDAIEEPDLQEAVTFESPIRMLRIRLRKSRRIWSPDGTMVDYIPAIWVEFSEGKLTSRDPWVVNELRAAQNNVANLKRRGFHGKELHMKRDRFYEIGAVTMTRAVHG